MPRKSEIAAVKPLLVLLLLLLSVTTHGQRALLVERATEYDERAVVADELRHDHQLALALTDSALRLWIALDDKLETARVLQYRAYLASRLGRTAEALGDVQESLRLYAEKRHAMVCLRAGSYLAASTCIVAIPTQPFTIPPRRCSNGNATNNTSAYLPAITNSVTCCCSATSSTR